MDRREHWEQVYSSKPSERLGWYKPRLQTSLNWIIALGLDRSAPVIDVGGGASTLVDDLLDQGLTFGCVGDDAGFEQTPGQLDPVGVGREDPAEQAAWQWRGIVEYVLDHAESFGDRYMAFRYEDMCADCRGVPNGGAALDRCGLVCASASAFSPAVMHSG